MATTNPSLSTGVFTIESSKPPAMNSTANGHSGVKISKQQDILPGFRRLSPKAHLYTPPNGSNPRNPDHPRLIIVASWMNALPKHVAKYITHHQVTYPDTPILLTTSSTNDFFLIRDASRRATFLPVAKTLKDILPAPDSPHAAQSILAHSFSNGGAGQLAFLAKVWRELTGRPLPVNATVFDSSPGIARFRQGIFTLSLGLPKFLPLRLILKLFMTVLYILWYTLPPYFGKKNLAQRFRDVLNGDGKGKNGELVMRKEGVRYYAFSKADKSIDERDVLAHAAQAKERGWRVCTESWENAEHVGLMRVEPERYWKIVEKAWAERG